MSEQIRIANFNARSLNTKFKELVEIVKQFNFTIICVTESWLKPKEFSYKYNIPGYELYRRDRLLKKGGGVAIYIKTKIFVSNVDIKFVGPEMIWIHCKIANQNLAVCTFYRPPKNNLQHFLNQFSHSMEAHKKNNKNYMLCIGDININLKTDFDRNYQADFSEKIVRDTFEKHGLFQIVNQPTRIGKSEKGISTTLIDPIFVSKRDFIVDKVDVVHTDLLNISDHKMVWCQLLIVTECVQK